MKTKNIVKDRILASLCIIGILNAICMFVGSQTNIIRLLLLLATIIILIFCKEKYILPIILFLHPNSALYDDIGFSYLFNITLFIAAIKLLICNKLKINKLSVSIFSVILCIEIIAILRANVIGTELLSIVSWIASYLVLILFSSKMKKIEFMLSYKYFFFGFVVAFICGIAYPLSRWGINNIPVAYRFTGLLRDPNYYSIDALLLIFSASTYAKLANKNQFVYMISAICMGICSVSKTFIVLLLLGFALKIILNMKKINIKKMFISILIIFTSILILDKTGYLDIIIEKFIYRTETTSIFTGRDYLLSFYLQTIVDNPINFLLGNSLLEYPNVLNPGQGNEYFTNFLAHNTYLDLILAWGIIGVILYTIFLICIVKNAKYSYRDYYLYNNKDFIIILTIFLFSLLVLSYLAADVFAIMLLYIITLKFALYKKNGDDENEE